MHDYSDQPLCWQAEKKLQTVGCGWSNLRPRTYVQKNHSLHATITFYLMAKTLLKATRKLQNCGDANNAIKTGINTAKQTFNKCLANNCTDDSFQSQTSFEVLYLRLVMYSNCPKPTAWTFGVS